MAAAAPITVTDEVKNAFKESSENKDDFGFLNLGIDLDKNEFVVIKTEAKKNTIEDTWKAMHDYMVDKTHTLFITKDPMKDDLLLLIHFAPDQSPVKQRMLYSASRSKLKQQLGAALFGADYHISKRDECDVKILKDQRTLHERVDFRSESEIDKEETSHEASAKSVRGQVMKNLPIQIEDSGKNAINSYKTEQARTVFLSLKQQTQSIIGEEQKANTPDDIKELLADKDPKYVLFWYADSSIQNSEAQRVFAYYCPEGANRNLKFTYSTCKANLLEYCAEQNIQFFAKVELSDKNDWKKEFLDYHVYPRQEAKQQFAKPKASGKKKKGRKKLSKGKIDLSKLEGNEQKE